MEWLIVLIAAAVIVVVAALAYEQGRSVALKRRFGPEYERVLSEHGNRRAAEAGLRAAVRRRAGLEVRLLTPEERDRYQARWHAAQTAFVDGPARSLAEADTLVTRVLRERGYPVDDFDERDAMLAVDHPARVADYRSAVAVAAAPRSASTDALRDAFLRYRSLFQDLLEVSEDEDAETTGEARAAEASDGGDGPGNASGRHPVASRSGIARIGRGRTVTVEHPRGGDRLDSTEGAGDGR